MAYSNWGINNPNSNAKVYFLSGQEPATSAGSLQQSANSLPKNQIYSDIYQSGVFPQAATLPAAPLPSYYGQAPGQLVRTITSQGNAGVQTQTPPVQVVQVSRTGNQPAVGVGTTGCSTCPGNINSANLVTQITRPVPQFVPVVNPNGVQGWYPAVMKAPAQGPIIRTTDEIRYPSVVTQQQTTTTTNTDAAIEKQQAVKTQATRNESALGGSLREVRNIGAAITLLGSLTVGLGIAGIVLYHSGKDVNSGLSWCWEAHALNNSLTKALLPSSPGINYVTSGAGLLGLMTFIVGIMTMNLESTSGPLPNATMWTSIFTLPVLVLMALLSLLSFIMTFRDNNSPPTCIALTVVTFFEILMAVIPFILLWVIYCKMQYDLATQYSRGYSGEANNEYSNGRVYPISKVSTIRVMAPPPGAQQCVCECCPCCMPTRNGCCPECNPYNNMQEEYEEEAPTAYQPTRTTTAAVAVQPATNPTPCAPVVRYPGGNNMYLWNQMAPYGQYSKAVYTPYSFNAMTK